MLFLFFACIQILRIPIFNIPFINHHVVILDKYAIDFTSVEDKSVLKLLLGRNVKAMVRLRYRDSLEKYDEDKTIKLNKSIYHSIKDPKIKSVIKSLFEWKTDMNLYTHNCQHFSSYAKKQCQLF